MAKGLIAYYVPGAGGGCISMLHQNFIPQSYENCTPLAKPGAVCGRAPLAEKFKI